MRLSTLTRRLPFLMAAGIFLIVCYLLYSSLEAANIRKKDAFHRDQKHVEVALNELQDKLQGLEKELRNNDKVVSVIRGGLRKALGGNVNQPLAPVDFAPVNDDSCTFSSQHRNTKSDVQILDVYDTLNFDNPDGGVWKQGWDIKYDKNALETAAKPLKVIVVPHSHCDPGWIKTFEQYYLDQTKNILDNMLTFLTSQPKMKFIYAEMSFFERWWRDLDGNAKKQVKKLLDSGQLEIVNGGWVMPDEANSHFFSMANQLIEGSQWLFNQLNYKPRNHWSIDPFGLSPSMTYVLSKSNFSTMIIQRVHYSVKKYLAQMKKLEFKWRQMWSDSALNDMQTHMFPFYSYDVPHTCGPEPAVCCQFDFKRLPGGGLSCPWNIPPVAITEKNVHERAETLLDQYRKKSELFATNVLLVPLGDDFRYDTAFEWNAQFENLNKLFEYMNSQKQWNIQASFGTLNDYFGHMKEWTDVSNLPVLSGDFFTYADRDDHYWSGYYTSRPFYKRMDRVLIHYLRGAEIVYSNAHVITGGKVLETSLFNMLVEARRSLALFQHHDGITGTAKDLVVVDYGNKMLDAIQKCKKIISACGNVLLLEDVKEYKSDVITFDVDDHRTKQDSLPVPIVINTSSAPRSVVVYNSLGHSRNELVCVQTSAAHVAVKDSSHNSVALQVNPVLFYIAGQVKISESNFETCFEATIPAMGFAEYTISTIEPVKTELAKVFTDVAFSGGVFTKESMPSSVVMSSPSISARIDPLTGMLQAVKHAQESDFHASVMQFVHYGTTRGKDKSGAYLFLPDGAAHPVDLAPVQVVFIQGSLLSRIHVFSSLIKHTLSLCNSQSVCGETLSVSNVVDISDKSNFELAMLIETDIKNEENHYFTDLNALQMIKRKYYTKLPLQAQVYPMASGAFIEDKSRRLSLLSAQPQGVASLNPGTLQVFLDRRLAQDDNRGLQQGVNDNKITHSVFQLVFESMTPRVYDQEWRVGYHTKLAHVVSHRLQYPLFVLHRKPAVNSPKSSGMLSLLKNPLACDIHVVNMRTMEGVQDYSTESLNVPPISKVSLILQRWGVDCRTTANLDSQCSTSNQVSIESLLRTASPIRVEETSLVGTSSVANHTGPVTLSPMSLTTFTLHFPS